jgi:tRNA(fMet)-specific endonuclease VapC
LNDRLSHARHEHRELRVQESRPCRAAAPLIKPSAICISAITVGELRYGARKRQSKKLHSLIDRFLAPFTVAAFGEAEAARYGELYAALERKGTRIGELDTQIAAHALTLGVTLVTNNDRHLSQVAGLRMEDWL